MRTRPLDFLTALFLYGIFHNALWLEPLKWNLLIEILILLILHKRFVRIWKSRNCSVTAPISVYSLLNTHGRLAGPSQSPELPETNYPKFKYTVPTCSQMCGKYYWCLNTLMLFMSSLLLSFVCFCLTYFIKTHAMFLPFISEVWRERGKNVFWEEGGMGNRAGRRWCLPGRKALGKSCLKYQNYY